MLRDGKNFKWRKQIEHIRRHLKDDFFDPNPIVG
jgi:hypothetical protein